MSETIMITGSSGNIGSEIIRQLSNSNSGITIKATIHSEGNRTNNDIDLRSVQLVEMDFNTPESIAECLKGVDKLFLLTPTHPKMVDFTSNLISGAKDVKHIVKLSHIKADAEPGITITRLHRQAEKVIQVSGIPYTFLRPNFFMQNFVNLYGQMIRDTDSFSLAAGDGKVSFVDIRDIASVAASVLTEHNDVHIGKSYDLTGPESLTYNDAAEILSTETGKKIRYIDISEDQVREGIKEMGINEWHANIIIELLRITRDGLVSEISPAVKKVTGKEPISFSTFANECDNVLK